MGEIRPPEPARLIVGLLAKGEEWIAKVEPVLAERFGAPMLASPVWPFTFTDYYGPGLLRTFRAYGAIDPAEIVAIKRWTNEVEARYPGRPVNLDPGYVTPGKLVLATTKDHAHRVYLSDGIYAEVTLTWTQGTFAPREWTYPDYRTPGTLAFFQEVRRSISRGSGRA